MKVMALSTTRIVDDKVCCSSGARATSCDLAQAPAPVVTTMAAPSLRFGTTRAAAEDDVIKEVELLKSIDQCAPA